MNWTGNTFLGTLIVILVILAILYLVGIRVNVNAITWGR